MVQQEELGKKRYEVNLPLYRCVYCGEPATDYLCEACDERAKIEKWEYFYDEDEEDET